MMGDESEFKDIQIQLTELGAIILNLDGTISKVENWQKLTPAEQAKTLRVIAKRNASARLLSSSNKVRMPAGRGRRSKSKGEARSRGHKKRF